MNTKPNLIKSRRSCIGCGMRPGALYSNGLCDTCQYPPAAPDEREAYDLGEEPATREDGEAWVQAHRAQGHDGATFTQIAAPGYGWGTWCPTCREYGPSNGGILTLGDVR